MRYTTYEVPMYHNGEFKIEPDPMNRNIFCKFVSETTGRTYDIGRVEPESLAESYDLLVNDDEFARHRYMEDVIISHEVSGVVETDLEGYNSIVDLYLDSVRVSSKVSECFQDSMIDTVQDQYNIEEVY